MIGVSLVSEAFLALSRLRLILMALGFTSCFGAVDSDDFFVCYAPLSSGTLPPLAPETYGASSATCLMSSVLVGALRFLVATCDLGVSLVEAVFSEAGVFAGCS
jgi:hypothetical protein